jgi:hypothetical protein
VWVAYAGPEPVLRVGRVDQPAEVGGWDLAAVAAGSHREWGEPDPGPLLLVCANGRRDRCCGHDGGRLADALQAGPWADQVLTSTHLGGHRFAPTALLLPAGVLHGRLDVGSAADVLAQSLEARTPTASLRGFSTLDEPAQVAEARGRTLLGYDGLAPLAVHFEPAAPPRPDPEPNADGSQDPAAAPGRTPSAGVPATPDPTPAPGPGRRRALVASPSGATVTVDLTRTSRDTLASCGRAPEPMARWSVVD